MHVFERRQYDMLVRVRDFGDRYGHLFPTSSVARQNFETVAAVIKELDAQDLTHMAASVSARAHRKEVAREALLARLQAVSQTARVLAEDAPGLDLQFPMPNSVSDQTLLTTGRKFARDAAPLSSQFIAHGMSASFIADVNALVDGFEHAVRDRGLGREAKRAARVSTQAALTSGRAAVRSLDAIVTNHLRDDEVTRTVWEQARRVVYPGRVKRADAMPEPTPGGAAPESTSGNKAA
jgi:hypothetical protein